MVDTMKEAFSTTLKSLHWMTPDSQTAALHKLANMMDLIGYPEQVLYCFSPMLTLLCNQVLNSTWLNAKYSEVEVSDDYLMNIVAFQSHQRKEGMKVYTRWVGGCIEPFFPTRKKIIMRKRFSHHQAVSARLMGRDVPRRKHCHGQRVLQSKHQHHDCPHWHAAGT